MALFVPAAAGAVWLAVMSLDRAGRPGGGPTPLAELDADIDPVRKEAFELADAIVSDFPDAPEALHARGLILNRFGAGEEALRCWRECLDIVPEFADPYYWIGWDALRRGDFDEAVLMLQKALELQPELPDVRLRLAEALSCQGQLDRATEILRQEVARNPTMVEPACHLGQVLLRQGEYEKSVKAYEKALGLDPECSFAWFGLAQAKSRLGREEEARGLLEKVQELKRKDFAATRKRKREHDDQQELRKGLATAYATAAGVYQHAERFERAEACWRKAVQFDPGNGEHRRSLARIRGEASR